MSLRLHHRLPLVGALGLVALSAGVGAAPAQAAVPTGGKVLAIIGDSPYGVDQPVTAPGFGNLTSAINSDPDVSTVVHLGDIKNGSTQCTDSYFDLIKTRFDAFADPFVYTPGDNEWTDCHRANNGAFIPTERLARIRQVFFSVVGQTLGAPRTVTSQGSVPGRELHKENVRFTEAGVVVGTFHVVGSNNDKLPWFTQAGQTRPPGAEQSVQDADVNGRTTAVIEWLNATFDAATASGAPGVVIAMQADMWDLSGAQLDGFDGIVDTLATRAAAFDKPVLLLEGDSHRFTADNPFAPDDPTATPAAQAKLAQQRAAHPATTTRVPKLQRVVVEGEQTREWLKLVIDPSAPGVFSYSREQVASLPAPVVPEVPLALLLPLTALGVVAGGAALRRRAIA